MKTLFVIAMFLGLAACGAPEGTPSPVENEMVVPQAPDPVLLNQLLPELAFDWRPHDNLVEEDEEAFLRVVNRLHLQNYYTSEDAALIEFTPCFFNEYTSPGTLLARTASGELWLLTEVQGLFRSSSRGSPPGLASATKFTFLRRYSTLPYSRPEYIVIEASDINRFVGIVEMVCPEDGERYEDAWMEYRFPRLTERRE